MSGFGRLVWLASKRCGGPLSIVFLIASSVTAYGQLSSYLSGSWTPLVYFIRDALLVYPAASAIGSWRAVQSGRTAIDELGQRSSRFGLGTSTIDIASLLCTVIVAWLIALLGPSAVILMRDPWGPIPWEVILTSSAGIGAFAVFGFTVGRFSASVFMVVLVAMLAYGLMAFGILFTRANPDRELLSPYSVPTLLRPSAIGEPRLWAAFVAAGWFSAVIIACLMAIWSVRRGGWPGTSAAILAVVLIAASGTFTSRIGAGVADQPIQPIPVSPRCQTGTAVVICIHPSSEADLTMVFDDLNAMLTPLVGITPAPLTVYDSVLYFFGQRPDAVIVVSLLDDRQAMLQNAVLVVSSQYSDPSPITEPMPTASQVAVGCWLASFASVPCSTSSFALAEAAPGATGAARSDSPRITATRLNMAVISRSAAFGQLPEAERTAWLRDNWEALRAGGIALEDLPGVGFPAATPAAGG